MIARLILLAMLCGSLQGCGVLAFYCLEKQTAHFPCNE
jgi:hypothetical protein